MRVVLASTGSKIAGIRVMSREAKKTAQRPEMRQRGVLGRRDRLTFQQFPTQGFGISVGCH